MLEFIEYILAERLHNFLTLLAAVIVSPQTSDTVQANTARAWQHRYRGKAQKYCHQLRRVTGAQRLQPVELDTVSSFICNIHHGVSSSFTRLYQYEVLRLVPCYNLSVGVVPMFH